MRETTLKSLIKKQKERIKLLQNGVVDGDVCDYCPDVQAYYDWVEFAQRFLDLHFKGDKYINKFCKLCDENFSLAQQRKLLSILKAFDALPAIIKKDIRMKNEKETNFVVNVSNNNSQSQNQCNEQKSVIPVSDNESPKPSSGILTKLKAGCFAVITGVLVDVLGDLNFWQWLHSQLELIIGCILL